MEQESDWFHVCVLTELTRQDCLIRYSTQEEKRDSTANSTHLQRDINIALDPFYLSPNFKDASWN